MGKIVDDFSGSWEPARICHIEIDGNIIFNLWTFTLQNFHRTNYIWKLRAVYFKCRYLPLSYGNTEFKYLCYWAVLNGL